MIYLASPYTHSDPAIREQRFEAVCLAAGKLMAAGEHVFSPIAHTHPIAVRCDLPKGWEFWQSYDRAMIRFCDRFMVLTLPGWLQSTGVCAERRYWISLGGEVEYLAPE